MLDAIRRTLAKVARLHDLGYLHGDLQPAHFVFAPDRQVHLLDFELTHRVSDTDFPYRGGLVHFDALEVAASILAGADPIPCDLCSENYSAAAVAFVAYTGSPSIEYEHDDATFEQILEAIAQNRLCTLTSTDADAFPELEDTLRRCLLKDRSARCPNLHSAIARLDAVNP